MKQTASIYYTPNRRNNHRNMDVHFYRDDSLMFKLIINSSSDAETLANHWRLGATQGQLAEMMQKMGMK